MFHYYYMVDTKKNKKVLKILKKEGFISYFYPEKKRIKIFLKQDFASYFKQSFFIKTSKNNLMFVLKNEFWKFNLKPGVFLLNTLVGISSERRLKRKLTGGCILTYIR